MVAAHYGVPLMLAIIGGDPRRFAPMVDLYHRALAEFGHTARPVGAHSPGHVGDTDESARAELWPHYKAMHDRIGAERGWGPLTADAFEREAGPRGSLYVGSPETVATKIAATASEFNDQYKAGAYIAAGLVLFVLTLVVNALARAAITKKVH